PHSTFVSYALAAMLGIFLIFQAATRSWRVAMVLSLLLPVTLVGGLLVALLSDEWSSLAAVAGLLGVLSIAARQSIAVASGIRRAHERDGGELTEALALRAAGERAGATVSTAIVVGAGLAPFALMGSVAGNE